MKLLQAKGPTCVAWSWEISCSGGGSVFVLTGRKHFPDAYSDSVVREARKQHGDSVTSCALL